MTIVARTAACKIQWAVARNTTAAAVGGEEVTLAPTLRYDPCEHTYASTASTAPASSCGEGSDILTTSVAAAGRRYGVNLNLSNAAHWVLLL